MIDLSGNAIVKADWSLDEETNILTVVFKQNDDTTELGTLVVDAARFQSIMAAISEAGVAFLSGAVIPQGHRTNFNNSLDKSKTEFLP